MTTVIPTTTGNPTPSSPSGSTDTPLVLSREILIVIIIVCVTAIVIPIVIIGLLAVVRHRHNRWAVREMHKHPEIAHAIGTLKACDDGSQMKENAG